MELSPSLKLAISISSAILASLCGIAFCLIITARTRNDESDDASNEELGASAPTSSTNLERAFYKPGTSNSSQLSAPWPNPVNSTAVATRLLDEMSSVSLDDLKRPSCHVYYMTVGSRAMVDRWNLPWVAVTESWGYAIVPNRLHNAITREGKIYKQQCKILEEIDADEHGQSLLGVRDGNASWNVTGSLKEAARDILVAELDRCMSK